MFLMYKLKSSTVNSGNNYNSPAIAFIHLINQNLFLRLVNLINIARALGQYEKRVAIVALFDNELVLCILSILCQIGNFGNVIIAQM